MDGSGKAWVVLSFVVVLVVSCCIAPCAFARDALASSGNVESAGGGGSNLRVAVLAVPDDRTDGGVEGVSVGNSVADTSNGSDGSGDTGGDALADAGDTDSGINPDNPDGLGGPGDTGDSGVDTGDVASGDSDDHAGSGADTGDGGQSNPDSSDNPDNPGSEINPDNPGPDIGGDDPDGPDNPDDPDPDNPDDGPQQPEKIDIANLKTTIEAATYTGSAVEPPVVIMAPDRELVPGVDFEVTYQNNHNAGIGTATIRGVGEFVGFRTVTFKITPAQIANAQVTVENQTYSGKALIPACAVWLNGVKLVEGVDYTVKFSLNKNAGMARATLRGKGNLKGKTIATFVVAKASASQFTVSPIPACGYTGSLQTPKPTVAFNGAMLKEGKDYRIAYKSNRDAGTATVVLKGQGNFKGSTTRFFTIMRASLAGASVSSIADQIYTGSAVCPGVSVVLAGRALVQGRDYAVTYSNNVDAGAAHVTITGQGNYAGSRSVPFVIVRPVVAPPTPSVVYWVPNGTVYHLTRSCPSLSRSRIVLDGSIAASRKPRVCKVCS